MDKNTEIFKHYDMVVSMTEDTINKELENLVGQDIIRSQLIISRVVKNKKYIYEVHKKKSEIPEKSVFIITDLMPRVSIQDSGKYITLELHLKLGTARFFSMEELTEFPIKDWVYSLNVNMGLKDVKKSETNILQPADVKKRIKEFTDDKFSVNALMMDFQDVENSDFIPNKTTVGDAGDEALKELKDFMNFYLKYLRETGNPFVLGYAVEQRKESNASKEHLLPPSLTPEKVTYSMYKDSDPNKSTLNFLLITKDNADRELKKTDNFPQNWISKDEAAHAKMIISRANLLEKMILEPLYNAVVKIGAGIVKDLQNEEKRLTKTTEAVHLPTANTFAQAKEIMNNANNATLVIADITSGNDRYTNKLEVSFENTAKKSVEVSFNGLITTYVNRTVIDLLPIKHREWITSEHKFKNSIILKAEGDCKGNPGLSIEPTKTIFDKEIIEHRSNQNPLVKVIALTLAAMTLSSEAIKMMLEKFILNDDTLGPIDVKTAFTHLGKSINNIILLPGGSVFYFREPIIDDEGNFSLLLTYKSKH